MCLTPEPRLRGSSNSEHILHGYGSEQGLHLHSLPLNNLLAKRSHTFNPKSRVKRELSPLGVYVKSVVQLLSHV